MNEEDKILQILAKILSDIGEIKESQEELEKNQAILEQRLNRLEGKPYAHPEHLATATHQNPSPPLPKPPLKTDLKKVYHPFHSKKDNS